MMMFPLMGYLKTEYIIILLEYISVLTSPGTSWIGVLTSSGAGILLKRPIYVIMMLFVIMVSLQIVYIILLEKKSS